MALAFDAAVHFDSAAYTFDGLDLSDVMPGLSTLTVEVAFGDGPLVATPTWTDITAYVMAVETRRGRNNELDRFDAGTARILARNLDRRFDPLHTASPYYPNVLPLRQVRISATDSGGTARRLFRGVVQPRAGWTFDYDNPNGARVTITCTDLLGVLALRDLPELGRSWSTQLRALQPRIYWRCNEASGTTINDVSGNDYDGTLSGSASYAVAGALVGDTDTAIQLGAAGAANGRWSVPTAGFNPGSGSWTIAAWIKVADMSVAENVVFYGEDAGGKKIKAYTSGGTSSHQAVYLDIEGSTYYSVMVSQTGAAKWVDVNAWAYVVWQYDATTGTVRLGNLSRWADYADWPFSTTATAYTGGQFTNEAWVGGDNGAVNDFRGQLDEVCMWHEAPSLDTFRQLVAAGLQTVDPDTEPVPLFDGDRSGTRVERVLSVVGVPAASRDIDTGQCLFGPTLLGQNALTYLQTCATSEGGEIYVDRDGTVRFDARHAVLSETRMTTSQATFGDTGSDVRYGEIEMEYATRIVNRASVERTGGISQTYTDAASVDAYAETSVTYSGQEMQTDPEAYGRAEWLVLAHKDPLAVPVGIELAPRRATTVLDQALQRELRDRVTVKFTPPGGGSQISKTCFVEQVEHVLTAAEQRWVTRFGLSSTDRYGSVAFTEYVELDHATRGKLDNQKLAF